MPSLQSAVAPGGAEEALVADVEVDEDSDVVAGAAAVVGGLAVVVAVVVGAGAVVGAPALGVSHTATPP